MHSSKGRYRPCCSTVSHSLEPLLGVHFVDSVIEPFAWKDQQMWVGGLCRRFIPFCKNKEALASLRTVLKDAKSVQEIRDALVKSPDSNVNITLFDEKINASETLLDNLAAHMLARKAFYQYDDSLVIKVNEWISTHSKDDALT